jgi:NitT/TauT family transport system substrate-binding protein
LKDFQGKRIAISNMGNPPFMFAMRALTNNGVETGDIDWIVYPNEAMELALDQGRIDGVASAEPIGTILLAHDKVRTLADQAVDAPYDTEYCCVTVVSGQLARSDPARAAKATRAILKGAKWVNENQAAAAKLGVDKKYIGATAAINAQAISKLTYAPGVDRARRDLLSAARDMKKCGFLKPTTDPEKLVKLAWLDLDGVSDRWIEGLKVPRVAGGGKPRPISPQAFVAQLDSLTDCREFRFCDCDW